MRRRLRFPKKILVVLLLIGAIVVYILIDNAIKPSILEIAEARLKAVAVKAMNDAVIETVGDNFDYSDMINVLRDNEGNITMLQANTIKMNNIATNTALKAQENILNIGEQGIRIPIGTVLGGQLLSGKGPPVTVKMEPVGSVTSEFKTEFEDAGINQTRHKIYLKLTASVKMVIGNTGQQTNVATQVLVSETIIIGKVPQSYMRFDEKDDMLNLLPLE